MVARTVLQTFALASVASLVAAAPGYSRHSSSKSTSVNAQDNHQENGQGQGGLIGVGADLLNDDTILGMSEGSNNEGTGNASKNFLAKRGNSRSSSSKTSVDAQDNSDASGVGAGGLIGIGADALNRDTILGLSEGTNNKGTGNASKNFLAKRGNSRSSSSKTSVDAQDNSDASGNGAGGLLGVGANALNRDTVLGLSEGTNNKGTGNASKNFLAKRGYRGGSSSSKKTAIKAEDNSEASGVGKGGLIGIGANALNDDTILGMSENSNNKGDLNGAKSFLAKRGYRGDSRSSSSKTSIKAEDNHKENGQGKGGLIGIGADLLNDDTVLGMSEGTNNEGDLNASDNFLSKRGYRGGSSSSSSKKTAIKAEDNSEASGTGAGGLIGVGANALNGDTILGLSEGTNNKGDGNAASSFL